MSTIDDIRKKMKEEVRDKIYNKAMELFIKDGYENTPLSKICKEVGIGKGTFFNYFPSKDVILARYYNELSYTALTNAKSQEYSDHRTAIRSYIIEVANRAMKHKELYLSLNLVKSVSHSLIDEENKLDMEFMNYCISHVQEAIRNGELNERYEAKKIAEILLSIATGTANEWRNSDKSWDLVEKLTERIDFLFYMAEPRT